jgi:hypothetical protein
MAARLRTSEDNRLRELYADSAPLAVICSLALPRPPIDAVRNAIERTGHSTSGRD